MLVWRRLSIDHDHLIALVCVLGILYVILFDAAPPPVSPVAGATASSARPGFVPPSLTTTATSVEPLLATGPVEPLSAEERARDVDKARQYALTPIPGELAEVEALFHEITTLEGTLHDNEIYLEPLLARSLADKLGEVKRYYIFQRTTRDLDTVVNHYVIPSSDQKDRLIQDSARMRALRTDMDWLETTAGYTFPAESKDYLDQLIEVLDGMARI